MSIQDHFSQARIGLIAINELPDPGLSCEYVLEGFTQQSNVAALGDWGTTRPGLEVGSCGLLCACVCPYMCIWLFFVYLYLLGGGGVGAGGWFCHVLSCVISCVRLVFLRQVARGWAAVNQQGLQQLTLLNGPLEGFIAARAVRTCWNTPFKWHSLQNSRHGCKHLVYIRALEGFVNVRAFNKAQSGSFVIASLYVTHPFWLYKLIERETCALLVLPPHPRWRMFCLDFSLSEH